jgi:Ca2+-binding RTX toxin-like protein
VEREGVEYGTPPATIFVGSQWVESGTITSFSRTSGDKTYGSIEGLQLDYVQAAAAALTADKSDDMALWAQAFAGNDFLAGSNGADRLEGFSGDDTMLGGGANDTLDGALGFDSLDGGAGNDILYGVDGNDQINGGRGADKLYGGIGADVFMFASIKDTTVKTNGRDTIYDFASKQKDKIDLRIIDANTKAKGNQAFKFIDKQDFHKKAGELQWEKVKGGVYVYGDVNGDGKADFSIFLKGLSKISKGDFFL